MLDASTFVSTAKRAASEQFFTFASLATWLLDTFGEANLGPVQEGDDPTAAVRSILEAVEGAGVDLPPSWTVTRLQTGSGAEVCGLLNSLADFALHRSQFSCEQPAHPDGTGDGYAAGLDRLDRAARWQRAVPALRDAQQAQQRRRSCPRNDPRIGAGFAG